MRVPAKKIRNGDPAVRMWEPPTKQFFVLAAFLVLVFLTGGSARADVQSLQLLRPIAILVAAWSLFTLNSEHLKQYRQPALLLAAVIGLMVVHLIPLSAGLWQALPGRTILAEIDALNGITGQPRPMSMVPMATMNAFYSLSVPIAVFGLAAQLREDDHARLLLLLVLLVVASGTLGFLQAIGLDLRFYALSAENAGVFANRNHQGVLLAMLFPMLGVVVMTGGFLDHHRALVLVLAVALALIAIPLIAITGSRAGMVAALLALALTPLVRLKRIRPRSKRGRGLLAATIGFGVVVVGVLLWLTLSTSKDTALSRFEASESDIRFPVWESIVDMLPTYLPWGSGIGSYADVYQILEPARLLRPTFSNHAHNEWLEIALTAGLPGLAILFWATILLTCAIWRSVRASGMPGNFARLGASITIVLAVASTVDYPVRTPIMASVLAVAAVWASSYARFGTENGHRQS